MSDHPCGNSRAESAVNCRYAIHAGCSANYYGNASQLTRQPYVGYRSEPAVMPYKQTARPNAQKRKLTSQCYPHDGFSTEPAVTPYK